MAANWLVQGGPVEDGLELFRKGEERLVRSGPADKLHADRQVLIAPVQRRREGGLPDRLNGANNVPICTNPDSDPSGHAG